MDNKIVNKNSFVFLFFAGGAAGGGGQPQAESETNIGRCTHTKVKKTKLKNLKEKTKIPISFL